MIVSGAPILTEHLRVYQHRLHTVLEFRGAIDLAAAIAIGPYLTDTISSPEPLTIIDLSETAFFDCAGIGLLCTARRRTRARGGSLQLVCPQPFVLRILRLLGLDELFQPVGTLEEAVAGAAPALD
ncbi:STAS domain-containing protein [Streptomyces sp. NPDC050264]|uniref:STAS domain-containing protein n=1 Tax=Streptomyces sp. NPDC050264 TaxID=3155038 RepID=UPI0034382869